MSYKLLPDIAIADVAFEAVGKDLSKLFSAAAQAYIDLSVNPKTVGDSLTEQFTLSAETADALLFDFLGELIYLKDAKSMVLSSCAVTVKEGKGTYTLAATLVGESINARQQELRNDVKAVTQHQFKVEQLPDKSWKAVVVLDI